MDVFVMVDIEGISGIYSSEQVLKDASRFSEGRRFMTEDINACVSGLKDAGVDKIFVCDCHGGGYSLEWNNASEKADGYICGDTGGNRFPNIDDFDAVILLGYHAMAGTKEAILEHTFSSKEVQNMYINDTKVGEIAVDAAIVGEHGKKVIMVSGDDKACIEAKRFLPNVVTAEVKKGLSTQGGILLPPENARRLIYEKTIEAVKNADRVKPFIFETPITCRIEMTERSVLPKVLAKPYMNVLDGRSFSITANSVEEALYRLFW